ncbi:hypothetical protein RFI_01494 [Reticulomyxa filosa]|uniref:Uncharacterized protein n=1 Tax=Reticulomyxa filosa TaxID=46433 RepID=X6PD07_RETFI|nr:hypothetical protein RFI_01494 [Reticulomyxa filosa]|eukprot:ETO35562.1 hypothetical protein RFI_01494 [Reticulomyxa filosa]
MQSIDPIVLGNTETLDKAYLDKALKVILTASYHWGSKAEKFVIDIFFFFFRNRYQDKDLNNFSKNKAKQKECFNKFYVYFDCNNLLSRREQRKPKTQRKNKKEEGNNHVQSPRQLSGHHLNILVILGVMNFTAYDTVNVITQLELRRRQEEVEISGHYLQITKRQNAETRMKKKFISPS